MPTRQSMSVSQTKPSSPGMQIAGLAGPESFWKQKWLGGQRSLRVAVGDADVGRVGGGRNQLAGGRIAPARRTSRRSGSSSAGSRGGRACSVGVRSRRAGVRNVAAQVERTGFGQSVSSVHGMHRHADPLVGGDVGAQAAEIAAAARGRRVGRVPGLQNLSFGASPGRRRVPVGQSDIGVAADRACRSRSRRAGWPGSRSSACRSRRCRSAGSRAAVSQAKTRSSKAASSTRAAGQRTRSPRPTAPRAPCAAARDHLIMLLTNGASEALGASSRYCL